MVLKCTLSVPDLAQQDMRAERKKTHSMGVGAPRVCFSNTGTGRVCHRKALHMTLTPSQQFGFGWVVLTESVVFFSKIPQPSPLPPSPSYSCVFKTPCPDLASRPQLAWPGYTHPLSHSSCMDVVLARFTQGHDCPVPLGATQPHSKKWGLSSCKMGQNNQEAGPGKENSLRARSLSCYAVGSSL